MADTLTPERAAERLCELSADVRAAVLLDAAGSLAGASEEVSDAGRDDARALGELARQLFEEVDRATRDWDTEPPEQVEVQVPGGAVFASRTPRWTLAAVAKRGALSSLMLYDLKAVLGELEGGPPIRRSRSAEERAAGPATEEFAAEELPMPELGGDVGAEPVPGDVGAEPVPGDGGAEPAPGDGGAEPAPGDGGADPAPDGERS